MPCPRLPRRRRTGRWRRGAARSTGLRDRREPAAPWFGFGVRAAASTEERTPKYMGSLCSLWSWHRRLAPAVVATMAIVSTVMLERLGWVSHVVTQTTDGPRDLRSPGRRFTTRRAGEGRGARVAEVANDHDCRRTSTWCVRTSARRGGAFATVEAGQLCGPHATEVSLVPQPIVVVAGNDPNRRRK